MSDSINKTIHGMTYAVSDDSQYDIRYGLKLDPDFDGNYNNIKNDVIKRELNDIIQKIRMVLRTLADQGIDPFKLPCLKLELSSDAGEESVSLKWETPYLRTGFFIMEDAKESGFFFTSDKHLKGSSYVAPLPPADDILARIAVVTEVIKLLAINTSSLKGE